MAWETIRKIKKVLSISLKNNIKYTVNLLSYTKVRWKNSQCVVGISSFFSDNTFETYSNIVKKSDDVFEINSYQTKYSIYGRKFRLMDNQNTISSDLLKGVSFPSVSNNCIIALIFNSHQKNTLQFNLAIEFNGVRVGSISSYKPSDYYGSIPTNGFIASAYSDGIKGQHVLRVVPTGSQYVPSTTADIYVITKHIISDTNPIDLNAIFFETI